MTFLFQPPTTIVVGAEEEKSRTVNIRNRDDQSTQNKGELIPLTDALDHMLKLKDERRITNKF
ncbi:hypothetical protein E4U54_005031 [Claviceps lovelessii]|nr:hypothetical protein E4U54_005031 [Claviceps lovelessii]